MYIFLLITYDFVIIFSLSQLCPSKWQKYYPPCKNDWLYGDDSHWVLPVVYVLIS